MICEQSGEAYFEGDEVDPVQDLIKTLGSKIVKGKLVEPQ
jgi:hypothetical protein